MASRSSAQYRCSICDINFPFKSKLERHLKSDGHRMFVECMQASSTQEADDFDDISCDVEINHGSIDTLVSDENDDNCDGVDDDDNDDLGNNLGIDIESMISDTSGDYLPFPNKCFALLYLLLHSPRPMGESNLKFIWFILAKCGLSVPSISQVKSFKLPGLTSPIRCLTAKGVPFYMNSITSIVQRCIGNPHISESVQRYPVVPNGPYREMFHASRWLRDTRFYSPMAFLPSGNQAFIRDCVRCQHPLFGVVKCVIVKYYVVEGMREMYAEMDVLLTLEQFQQAVPDNLACFLPYGTYILFESISLPVKCVIDVCEKPLSLLKWEPSVKSLVRVDHEECSHYLKPHPLKDKAAGKPIVMLPLILFSDDTSGNKSKKWHLFDSWSVTLAGLPRHENSKISNIHFCCCSDKVSAMDMSIAIAPDLTLLEKEGVEAYDAKLQQAVLVVSPLMCVVADNPRASEILNHLGGSAKRYCRICMVDKDVNPTEVAEYRSLTSSLQMIEEIRSKDSEGGKATLRTRYGLRDDPNPMLNIPADLYGSTPIEALHTLLLGPYKYLLKTTIPKLSTRQKEEVLARVRSFNFSGFCVRLIGNVVRHHKSFVGRDYKAWAQMAPFIITPYLSERDNAVWMALSKLFKIAYCDYFDPSKAAECNDICKSFVETVSECMPEMLKKQKVHLLLHLVECMDQFGPTSAFNSERFESFNSFIRVHNIFGNKSAPSKDIARRFGELEQLRHICEGGLVLHGHSCGQGLQALYTMPTVQHFINCIPMCDALSNKIIYQPGSLRKRVTRPALPLSSLSLMLQDVQRVCLGNLSLQNPPFTVHFDNIQPQDIVEEFGGIIGQSGKLIHTHDFVELHSTHHEARYGILLSCCKAVDGRAVCIVRGLEDVQTPTLTPILNEFDCPLLKLTQCIFTLRPQELVKAVSIVHYCTESCRFIDKEGIRNVEREDVTFVGIEFKHNFIDNNMFCLNVYCIGT